MLRFWPWLSVVLVVGLVVALGGFTRRTDTLRPAPETVTLGESSGRYGVPPGNTMPLPIDLPLPCRLHRRRSK
ncbi:MAG TPA: hypothetical protein VGK53_23760 [Propionicimonas sp.]|jgi:hypothetical protein